MIMRVTVHNRKYIPKLEGFIRTLSLCNKYYEPGKNVSENLLLNDRYIYETLKEKMSHGDVNMDQVIEFIDIIVSRFKYYCLDCPFTTFDKDEQTYLLANIDISFQTSLTPKSENGEVIYVFLNAASMNNNIIIL